jgi:hypothetical protein
MLMNENLVSDPKIKVKKLVAETNWAKWKWQTNMHFEQYYMMSIIDRSWKCPNIMNTEEAPEDDHKICWRGNAIIPRRRR